MKFINGDTNNAGIKIGGEIQKPATNKALCCRG